MGDVACFTFHPGGDIEFGGFHGTCWRSRVSLGLRRLRPRLDRRPKYVVILVRPGPYVWHQREKTRRIRFVTPTKLPYPWNLMS